MLGFRPLGSGPLGSGSNEFTATFELNEPRVQPSIVQITSFVERALIEELHRSPDILKTINRRLFESVVAEIFSGQGYDVELTQQTRDGGKDIVAIRSKFVPVKFLIECKRPDPGNPVGVRAVRELHSVKIGEGATKAILATTTHFTSGAKQMFEKHRWELEPQDFEGLKVWIAEYVKMKRC